MANKFRGTSKSVKLTKAQTRVYENSGPAGDSFRREARGHAQTLANKRGGNVEIYSNDGITFEAIGAPGVVVSADKWRIPLPEGVSDPRRLLRSFPSGTRVRAALDIAFVTGGGEVAQGALGTVRRVEIVQGATGVVPVLWDCLGEIRDTSADSIDEVES